MMMMAQGGRRKNVADSPSKNREMNFNDLASIYNHLSAPGKASPQNKFTKHIVKEVKKVQQEQTMMGLGVLGLGTGVRCAIQTNVTQRQSKFVGNAPPANNKTTALPFRLKKKRNFDMKKPGDFQQISH